MNPFSRFDPPGNRLQIAATAIVAAAAVLTGCGPQQASPPGQPVATSTSQAPGAGAGQALQQPTTNTGVPANIPYQPAMGQPGSGSALPYPPVHAPQQGQPVPMQVQSTPTAPAGYATAPQRYSPTSGQPVPPAAAAYQDGPPPRVAQAYPAPVAAPVAMPAKPQRHTAVAAAPVHRASDRIGRVASIEPIRERPQGSGAGGVLGGVLGAVVGNQFGHGNGRAALTVLGGVGGAVAGNNVERNVKERVVGYRIHVELDDGAYRTYEESSTEGLRVGDRIRVEGNALRRI